MVNDDAGGTNIKTPDVLKGIGDVSEAFAPYVSLIGTIALTTEETLKILENVEYNKKTCKNLIDRIQAVEFSIKLLVRRREENEKKFRDEVYYKAFYRLVLNLEEIKNFVRDVSRLSGLRKFIDSGAVKKKFKELINEYDQAIIALHFTKCIADEEQREQDFKDLDDDMNEMTKFLEVIEAGVTDNNKKINDVLEQISLMWQDLLDKLDENARIKPTETSNNNKEEEEICVPKIEHIVLTDVPFAHKGDIVRGKVCKKYCRDFGIYVACKGDKSLDKKEKEFPRYIAFLKKISKECNYIIKFYGISTINGNNVMVMDWAAYGNLRDFYILNEIKWAKKLEIVLDICRGITFLHAVNYLHHDIRCENILLGNNYSPKITNFKLSRRDDQVDKSIELGLQLMLNIINWMAPEKLKNQKNPYTKQCEIFSFGMLMWELAFERKPYEGWGMEKIKKHVIENGREMVHFKKPENKESQDKYVEIMKEAWSGDPTCRPTFQKIVLDLNNLITIEKEKTRIDNSPWLRPREGSEVKQPPVSKADQVYSSNLISSSSVKPACSSKPQSTMIETKKLQNIPTILTGIAQHKKGHREKALEIFTEHVKLDNKTAKFWYGYYLLEGYAGLEKNRKEATKYFREAAEEGVPDAQLRYAHILLDDSKDLKNGPDPGTLEQILCYFTLAADNKNASARYLLGSLYYHGKHGVKQDKEKGLHYIKLAAIQKHHKAIALLGELKEDPYQ